MNYLTQYIIENQLLYYNIFFRPIYVLKHLLFSSHNCENGNPYEFVSFSRKVFFTEYYKETKTLDENIRFYEYRFQEKHIEETHKNWLHSYEYFHKNKTEQELWKLSHDRYYKYFNAIEFLNYDNLFSHNYWYSQLLNTDYFLQMIDLRSYDHFIINKLNYNTDLIFLNLSKLIVQVFIDFYTNIVNSKINIANYQTPYLGETVSQTLDKIGFDLKQLIKIQKSLAKI